MTMIIIKKKSLEEKIFLKSSLIVKREDID